LNQLLTVCLFLESIIHFWNVPGYVTAEVEMFEMHRRRWMGSIAILLWLFLVQQIALMC
jgi:hypothetical protein